MSPAIFVLIIAARARVESHNDSPDPNSHLYRHSRHAHAWSRRRVSRLHIIIPHGYSSSNPELCLQLDYRTRSPSLSARPFSYHARVIHRAYLFRICPLTSHYRPAFSTIPPCLPFTPSFTAVSN